MTDPKIHQTTPMPLISILKTLACNLISLSHLIVGLACMVICGGSWWPWALLAIRMVENTNLWAWERREHACMTVNMSMGV